VFTHPFVSNLAVRIGELMRQMWGAAYLIRVGPVTPIKLLGLRKDDYVFVVHGRASHRPVRAHLPAGRYFILQTEQLNTPDRIRDSLLAHTNLMRGARAIFEYNKANVARYPSALSNKVFFVSPPTGYPLAAPMRAPRFDVLLYGTSTYRRRRILHGLRGRGFTCKHVERVFGTALTEMIGEARCVLNLHASGAGRLEMCRIHEAAHLPVRIVSELPGHGSLSAIPAHLRERVAFVERIRDDLSNLGALVAAIASNDRKRETPEAVDAYCRLAESHTLRDWKVASDSLMIQRRPNARY
jgi:hypothetical protein